MAFFAALDRLPAARAQWNGKYRGNDNPKDDNPTVRPRTRPEPPNRQTSHHCTDGFKRVLVTVPSGNRQAWTCSGPIPYAYRSLIEANNQVRGRKKPLIRRPAAVREDKVYRPARRVGYKKARAKQHLNENVEGN